VVFACQNLPCPAFLPRCIPALPGPCLPRCQRLLHVPLVIDVRDCDRAECGPDAALPVAAASLLAIILPGSGWCLPILSGVQAADLQAIAEEAGSEEEMRQMAREERQALLEQVRGGAGWCGAAARLSQNHGCLQLPAAVVAAAAVCLSHSCWTRTSNQPCRMLPLSCRRQQAAQSPTPIAPSINIPLPGPPSDAVSAVWLGARAADAAAAQGQQ
jgi:hypothetical protein